MVLALQQAAFRAFVVRLPLLTLVPFKLLLKLHCQLKPSSEFFLFFFFEFRTSFMHKKPEAMTQKTRAAMKKKGLLSAL